MRLLSPPRPPPKLRLDDILDYLQGEGARDLVTSMRERLERQGVDFHKVIGPGVGPMQLPDAFEDRLAWFLRGSFLLPSETVSALPAAATTALAYVSDEGGLVARDDVRRVFGNTGADFFEELQRRIGDRPVPTQRRELKYRHLPEEVITRVARSALRTSLVKRMPAIARVFERMGGPQALSGLKFVSFQHLFPSMEPVDDAVKAAGADVTHGFLLGKNYSTNPDVMYRMIADGWPISTLSMTKLNLVNPDGTTREVSPISGLVQRLLTDVDPSSTKAQFVVLDESGEVLEAIHRYFPEYAHLFLIVVQTERALLRIRDLEAEGIKLLSPVINLAGSWAKKEHESAIIGENVVHSAFQVMEKARHGLKPAQREASVIGYGAVGREVARALRRRNYTVYVHDIDPKKMAQAAADGFLPRPREETLAHGHLLFSATGRTTITPDEFDRLLPDKAILVNAASGNQELGMDRIDVGPAFLTDDPLERVDELGFRTSMFEGSTVVLGDLAGKEESYSRVLRTPSGHERLVLRSGYVVNLRNDIPPEYIQLTRALLLGALLQAGRSEGQTGLIPLDEDVQNTAVNTTRESLAKRGLSLDEPDFERLPAAD